MFRRYIFSFCFFAVALLAAAQSEPDSTAAGSGPRPQSVGLVLSGGGAKGIAHIGVIKALEDNDIPIDYIAGTSMGAIVGGLYAMGYTPEQMLALIESKEFTDWSTGTIDKRRTYFFLQEPPLPSMITLNLGRRDSTRTLSILPTSLINPLPMNLAFMELFAPYTAQCGGDFNKLFVPFRAVASDVTAKQEVVCKSGSLGDAIRASMSFPLVFHPIEMNGHLMYDGGIYDNFPVKVMRDEFAPQIMIGVDVAASESATDKSSLVDQLETMIMQKSDYRLPARQGIKIRLHLEQFGLLDFAKAKAIYKLGYDKAMTMMDSIKHRVTARIPAEARNLRREVFCSQTPYLRFDSVNVSGGTPGQNDYIRYLFTHNRPDTFGAAQASEAYYRAITPGKITNLVPDAVYDDTTRMFTLNLRAKMKDKYQLGIGGFLTTSTNSMLFLSGAYRTLSFNSLDVRFNGWVGQSYLAGELNAQIRLLRATPSSLQIQAVASRRKYFPRDRFFFQTNEHTIVTHDEYFGRVSYGIAAGNSGKVSIGAGFGHTNDKYYHEATSLFPKHSDRVQQNLLQALASYEYNTLNSISAPTSGAFYSVKGSGVMGQHYFDTGRYPAAGRTRTARKWLQFEAVARNYWNLSPKIALGTEVTLLASSRKLLPDYVAAMLDAPEFVPAPSLTNVFSPGFRANSFATVGIVPVARISSILQLRARADLFLPLRPIMQDVTGAAVYGPWCSHPEYFCQLSGVVTLPFGDISVYSHYASVVEGRWNFGLTFGLFIQAPRFLR